MNGQFKQALFNAEASSDSVFYDEIEAASVEEKSLRLNVYRNNIFVSLIDALRDIFPVTQQVVGEAFFQAMARQYLLLIQPKSPVISEYGDQFSAFIQSFPPAQTVPYLADLAALEYAMLCLTYAEEHQTLEREQIASIFSATDDPATLYLSLPPASQILRSQFAIGSLYQAHQADAKKQVKDIDINTSEYLFISKSHLYAQLHIVSESEAVFITNLMGQQSLEEALPIADEFDLGSFLAKLIDWKLLVHIAQSNLKAANLIGNN